MSSLCKGIVFSGFINKHNHVTTVILVLFGNQEKRGKRRGEERRGEREREN
jgi:hypothetical protein